MTLNTIFTIFRIIVYFWVASEFLKTAFVYSLGLKKVRGGSKIIDSLIKVLTSCSFILIYISLITIVRIFDVPSYLFLLKFFFIPLAIGGLYMRKFRHSSLSPAKNGKVEKAIEKVRNKI